MKKKILIISAICVVVIGAAIAVYLICFQKNNIVEDKNNPETIIKNFEKSFNNYDIDAMLDCIDPAYIKTINLAGDLLSKILPTQNWNISTILNLAKIGIPLIPYIPDLNITSDDLPHLSLNITDSEVDGDNANCNVSGTLTVGTYSKDFTYVVTLDKVDDKWYILKAE